MQIYVVCGLSYLQVVMAKVHAPALALMARRSRRQSRRTDSL